jgi:hypothetical protein
MREIGEVTVTVGERQLFCLDRGVNRRGIQWRIAKGKAFEHAQNLQCGDALCVGRQLVDLQVAEGRRERLYPFAVVRGKVLAGDEAALARKEGGDLLGDGAMIEDVWAMLRDCGERAMLPMAGTSPSGK